MTHKHATDYALAVPNFVSTQGISDQIIGIATQGWIIQDEGSDPVVTVPLPDNIGSSIGNPRQEWWVREDVNDVWFGPLSYRDANFRARRMTDDATSGTVKTAEVGTILGARGGDPAVDPNMFIVFLYVNGKQTLGSKVAIFNSKKNVAP